MMKELKIPPTSVSVGHEYVQHADSGWRGEHYIRYHSYLVPEKNDLPDKIAFCMDTAML